MKAYVGALLACLALLACTLPAAKDGPVIESPVTRHALSVTEQDRAEAIDAAGDTDGVAEFDGRAPWASLYEGHLVPETSPLWDCRIMGDLECGRR